MPPYAFSHTRNRNVGELNPEARAKDPGPSYDDMVTRLVFRAEHRAGYTPGKIGWLTWSRRVFRGEKGFLQQLQKAAAYWPPLEREIFELYYVNCLALADIALMAGCTSDAFQAHLRFLRHRLREALLREVLLESELPRIPRSSRWPRCRSGGDRESHFSHRRRPITVHV
jgi:hypothetical protein